MQTAVEMHICLWFCTYICIGNIVKCDRERWSLSKIFEITRGWSWKIDTQAYGYIYMRRENYAYHCSLTNWIEEFWSQVILDEAIVRLIPDFFLLDGGEVSLKLAIRTLEFIQDMKNRHFHQVFTEIYFFLFRTVMTFEVETFAVHFIGSWDWNSVGRSLDL